MRLCVVLMFGLLAAGCVAPKPQRSEPSALPAQTPSVNPAKPIAPFTAGNKTPYEVFGEVYEVMPDSFGYLEIGVASWYGKKFHGRLTSNGEKYDMYQLSAAHKTLPIPSMVKVTNLDNGKHVVLRINDRGPFHDNRIIDLSYAAAKAIGYADQGVAPVVVEALNELNHPERFAALQAEPEVVVPDTQYFLQLGAFSEARWAKVLEQQVTDLFLRQAEDVKLKILQSERPDGALYRVWLGPMRDESHRAEIATLVEDAKLGKPINVEVE